MDTLTMSLFGKEDQKNEHRKQKLACYCEGTYNEKVSIGITF